LGRQRRIFSSIPVRFSRAGMLSSMGTNLGAIIAAGVDARIPISSPPHSFKSERTSAAGSTSRSTRSECTRVRATTDASAHAALPSACFPIERRARPPRPAVSSCIGASRFIARDSVQDFDWIGAQRPQSIGDQRFQIRRGNSLTVRLIRGFAPIAAGNEAAGDVIAIPGSSLYRVGRGHGIAWRRTRDRSAGSVRSQCRRRAARAGLPRDGFCTFCHSSSSMMAACSPGKALPLWTISPR